MAMNTQEAQTMLASSAAPPDHRWCHRLSFKADRVVQELLADGYLGEVLSVELRSTTPAFVDKTSPLHWRQDREMSGYNVL